MNHTGDDTLAALENRLGYRFRRRELLHEALRHRSWVNEQNTLLRDNERLEFLGDAVVNLVVGHLLMRAQSDLKEGDLSRMRAALVNEAHLATVARRLGLGDFVRLGRGESQTGGREKNSILADSFEAVSAALYLDAGFDTAFAILETHFKEALEKLEELGCRDDYKSRLQELVQEKGKEVPRYRITGQSGPDHDKTFTARLTVSGITTEGRGKSKKQAEQDAARRAIRILKKTDTP